MYTQAQTKRKQGHLRVKQQQQKLTSQKIRRSNVICCSPIMRKKWLHKSRSPEDNIGRHEKKEKKKRKQKKEGRE